MKPYRFGEVLKPLLSPKKSNLIGKGEATPLVALVLLVAESLPDQKEMLIPLVEHFIELIEKLKKLRG